MGSGGTLATTYSPVISSRPSLENQDAELEIQWVYAIPSAVWFEMSQWTKMNGLLNDWERCLLFNLGLLVAKKKSLTIKQAKQARRLYDAVTRTGFKDSANTEESEVKRPLQ